MGEVISGLVQFIIGIFKFHKLKLIVAALSFVLSTVLFFPYNDLADVITVQVAKATNNQVFIQFEELGLKFFPTPGVNLEEVVLESAGFPSMEASQLSLSPSIKSLLTFKPGFSASADGLLGGQMDVTVSSGEKVEDNVYMQNIDLDVEELDLKKLNEILALPVDIRGRANLVSGLTIDPNFKDQPEGEIQINAGQLKIPPSTVPTQFGPMALPGLTLSNVKIKGRIAGGQVNLEEVTLGKQGDPLFGRVKGSIDLRFARRGLTIRPNPGRYDLKIELNVTKAFQQQLTFLSFLDSYKSDTLNGSRYGLRVSGIRFGSTPRMEALPRF